MTYSVHTTICDSFVNKTIIPLNPKPVEITFKNSVRTSKRRTPHLTITKINWLIVFKEIIAVYSENHTRPKNTESTVTDLKQVVPTVTTRL
jgi:hypothetical protein